MPSATEVETIAERRDATKSAGLTYVSDEEPGITRRRAGKGFTYRDGAGRTVKDEATLARIRRLAVPPAYEDVWICASPNGHIQATGRDARGRKQYRYHAKFRQVRDAAKYDHLLDFARSLPDIRKTIAGHLTLEGIPREKVLAAVVSLLEATLIRVGNGDYAQTNRSYGLTTLKSRHVEVRGSELRFKFKGKSGREWDLGIRDRRIARIVRDCQELPGQELFQYLDEEGQRRSVSSTDVNDYLRSITGREVTAKDFRTWAGTVLAALALAEFETFESETQAKRNLRAAIEAVAIRLGNTPTICRKCYVHPALMRSYLQGGTLLDVKEAGSEPAGLRPQEAAVLRLLEGCMGRDRERGKAAEAA